MPNFKKTSINSGDAKKVLAGLLSLTVIASSMGAVQKISANDTVEIQSETEENVTIVKEFDYIPDPDILPSEEECYQKYLDRVLYRTPYSIAAYGSFGEGADSPLNATEQKLYVGLKAAAEKIANGEKATSVISVSGLDDLSELNFNLVMSMVLEDCPYSFYWFDKTINSKVTASTSTVTGKSTITMYSSVSANYSVSGETGTTDIDIEKTSAASKVKSTAMEVVRTNAGKSDFEKLAAYRDYILDITDYDYDALDASVPYGDPWQIIHVFDGDANTKVVCEGYAKAFQYLCDLSVFEDDVFCMTVSGKLYSPSVTGDHMWNVVSIKGKSYLVDLSNSDTGMAGSDGELFFAVPSKGSYANGYTITIKRNDLTYVYSSDSSSTYGEKYLTLASEKYSVAEKNVAVVINGTEKNFSDIESAIKEINRSTSGGTVYLLKDIKYSGDTDISVSKSCEIRTNGHTLNLGDRSLNLFEDLTVVGTGTITSRCSSPVISSNSSSILSISEATVSNTGTGAAVESGTLKLSGGTYIGKVIAKNSSVISDGQFNGEVELYDSARIDGGHFKGLVTVCNNYDKEHFYGGSFGVGMSSGQRSISSAQPISSCIAPGKMFFMGNEPVDSSSTALYGPVSVSNAVNYNAMYTSGSTVKKFETIMQALESAPSGSTVSLINNCTLTSDIVISGEITLDLNGKELNCGVYAISSSDNMTIEDTSSSSAGSDLILKAGSIKIRSGYIKSLSVQGGTIKDILADGKGYKSISGQWLSSDAALSSKAASDVYVNTIPITSFTVCDDILYEIGADERIILTADIKANAPSTIEWYKEGSNTSIGSGTSLTLNETLSAGEYVYIAKVTSDGYIETRTVNVTISPHVIKTNEIAFSDNSSFEREYNGTDVCSSVSVVIIPGTVGNTSPIPVKGTIKYDDPNVSKASKVTFIADAAKTDSYTVPFGLSISHAASIKKAAPGTPAAPRAEKVSDTSILLAEFDDMEYSIDKVNWQPSPEFVGLLPNHEYTVYQRVSESENCYASDISIGTNLHTLKTSLNSADVKLSKELYTYDGTSHKPEITVILNGTEVNADQYSVSFTHSLGDESLVNAGKIEISVTAKESGDYSGSISVAYTIEQAEPHIGEVSVDGEIFTSTYMDNSLLARTDNTIPGKLEFLSPDFFSEGSNKYQYIFTPNNFNYKTVTGEVSCYAAKDFIRSLVVSGQLEKREYVYGEKPFLEGVLIEALYNSGIKHDVTSMVKYDSALMAGQTSLKVSFGGVSADIPITVKKGYPTYTVIGPYKAQYGSALSDIELPAGWAWVNPSQTLETLGKRKYSVIFTPKDTKNYNTVLTDIDVETYLKAPDTATGNKAVYGQTLSEIALPKGWEWKDPSLKVGNAGERSSFTAVYGIDGLEADVFLDIEPAMLSISNVKVSDKDYDGSVSALVESIEFIGYTNEDSAVSYEYSAFFGTPDAGDNKEVAVKVTLDSSNYFLEKDTIVAIGSIRKAKSNVPIPKNISVSLSDADFLYDIILGDGWSWDDGFAPLTKSGTYTFTATYNPTDNNYLPIKSEIMVVISACSHSSISENQQLPDCTNDGYIEKVCNDCGEVIYKEILEASHLWGKEEILKEADCTEDGLSVIKCASCGKIKSGSQKAIPARGHIGGTATCQHGAVCSSCKTEYTLPVEHVWKESFSKSEKYHWHECSVCGERTAKEKHSFKDNVCSDCGYKRTIIEENEEKIENAVTYAFWDISVGEGINGEGKTISTFNGDDYIVGDIIGGAAAIACALIGIGAVSSKEKKHSMKK